MNNQPHINIDNIIQQTNHLALLLQLYLQDVTAQNQQHNFNDNLKATWVEDSMSQDNRIVQEEIHALQRVNSQKYSQDYMMQLEHSQSISKSNQIFQQSSSEQKNQLKLAFSNQNIKPKQEQLQVQRVDLQILLGKAIQSCLTIVDIEFQIKKTNEEMTKSNSLSKKKKKN